MAVNPLEAATEFLYLVSLEDNLIKIEQVMG
jgi:hypothetical protein